MGLVYIMGRLSGNDYIPCVSCFGRIHYYKLMSIRMIKIAKNTEKPYQVVRVRSLGMEWY